MTTFTKRTLCFLGFMLPYFAVVFYFALAGPGSVSRAPAWLLRVMLIYFLGGIALFGVGGRLFKARKQEGAEEETVPSAVVARSIRSVRRLLVLYLILFPVGLAEVFIQRELPIRIAILALIVPVLIMVALWRWLRRMQQTQAQQ
jgi:hypothetical protein